MLAAAGGGKVGGDGSRIGRSLGWMEMAMRERSDVAEKMRRVAALVVDVEGSLTDGLVTLGAPDAGLGRLRDHDVVGLQLAKAAGWPVILLAWSDAASLQAWAAEVGVDQLCTGVVDKLAALEAVVKERSLDLSTVAYLGDELLDVPAMEVCGLAAAPRNAVLLVREQADLVLDLPAGHGALRELVDRVLACQEQTCTAISGYLDACGNVAPGKLLAAKEETSLRPKIGFRG